MIRSIVAAAVLLTLAPAAQAQLLSIGFGAGAGLNIPIAQDDQGTGSVIGLRAMIQPLSLITFEANLNFARYGDPELDLEGSKVTSYGVEAVLGGGARTGVFPFLTAGIGFFDIQRDQTEAFDEDGAQFGWTGGLGIGVGLASAVGLDVRGRLNVIPTEGGSSHKSAMLMAGINYYLGK